MSGNVGGSHSNMIRLAPSPRDSVKIGSPRSLRSPTGLGSPKNRQRQRKELAVGPEMDTNDLTGAKAKLFAGSGGGSPRSHASKSSAGKGSPMEPPARNSSYTASATNSPKPSPRASRRTSPPKSPKSPTPSARAALNTSTNAVAPDNLSPKSVNEAAKTKTYARDDSSDTRSKKIKVVDPESGKKVKLDADDHSLTDKELHVYHKRSKKKRQQQRAKDINASSSPTAGKAGKAVGTLFKPVAGGAHRRSVSEGSLTVSTQRTTQTHSSETATQVTQYSLGETLETASALTEVSYGRYKLRSGPFNCIVPTSCRSVEQMALGGGFSEFVRFGESEEEERLRERRDDVESVEKERFQHLLEEGEGNKASGKKSKGLAVDTEEAQRKDKTGSPPKLLSPLSALGGLVSPRISSLAKNFFDNQNGANVPEGEFVEVKFRRICLVVFPDEVRQCLEPKKKGGPRRAAGLLGMTFDQSSEDFQAHVSYVQRGSKADRMGVKRGDIVSFAVALSNMTEEQNSFLAEKLIKRLESVGMRTSYRELYDIFLSKTTNERPIGMVFRRWKNRGGSPKNALSSVATRHGITDEFEWSTGFLQSLCIKCREHEFERKVMWGVDEKALEAEEDLTPLSFLPQPNVNTTPSAGMVADYLSGLLDSATALGKKYHCGSDMPVMKCVESTFGVPECSTDQDVVTPDFLSNRVLCSLVEQSMGLIFLRRVKSSNGGTSGTGFTVVRKAEGSWSAPCFLSVLGSKDAFTDSTEESSPTDDVKMIVIRKKEMVNNLILGNAVKFSVRTEERANVLVRDAAIIGMQEGRFELVADFFLAVKVNDAQNQGAYSLSTDHIEAPDILTGTISPPEQTVDFYGALQSLELPYSMHSHPVIPEMLQPFSESDWVEFLPDNTSGCGMRKKLGMISENGSAEDRREIDIFARKFQYYLMDGVPVMVRVLSSNNSGMMEEKVLRLTIKDPSSLFSSSLELTRRRRPGVSNVGVPSNFSATFESVTKLSRTPPASLAGLDEEERQRFFSVETDLSPGPVMMLAKSKKDAMILLCGLKLLLEREKILCS